MKRVLIADDHPVFRAGLRQIIEDEGYEVIAEAGNGNSCITNLEIIKPDIVTLDLALPDIDGYDVLKWIKANAPSTITIIISMHSSHAFASRAKELGARAFVAKEDAAAEINKAFLTPSGTFYLSSSVGGGSTPVAEPEIKSKPQNSKLETLTPAEHRVFDLVGQSLTSRQIGEQLGLSYRTVQTHRQHINQKLGLQGSNTLLEFAIRYKNDDS